MIVTSAQYQNDEDGNLDNIKVTIDDVVWFIQIDESDAKYQAVMAWVSEGNTIADAD
jgi:hypothetical protein